MTNEKLTNEEVIKILKEAIDVINRQETKIVILKDYTKDLIAEIRKLTGCEIISNFTENQRRIRREAKTEAYKEFAEHLKEEWFNHYYSSPDLDFYEFVDKFLKETLGEEEWEREYQPPGKAWYETNRGICDECKWEISQCLKPVSEAIAVNCFER